MFKDRLKQALAHADMKASTLAVALGISRSAVSQWVNASSHSAKAGNLVRAAKILGVDSAWLATGEGKMVPTPREALESYTAGDKARLLTCWDKLAPSQKSIVLNMVTEMAGYVDRGNNETDIP